MSNFNFQPGSTIEDTVQMLIEQLNWIMSKLDSRNVKRLFTEQCDIQSEDGSTQIKGPQIIMKDAAGNVKLIQGLDKATGTFVFTLEDGVITGGKFQTAKTGARIEITGNKLTTYNAVGQMHGPRIYPGDGDIVFCYNGIPVLSVGLAGLDGVSIQAQSGYPLIIDGYPTYDWVIDHTSRSSEETFGVFGVGPASQQTAALLPEDGSSTMHDIEVKINGILNKLAVYGLFSID
jgi:hypothetical protein